MCYIYEHTKLIYIIKYQIENYLFSQKFEILQLLKSKIIYIMSNLIVQIV